MELPVRYMRISDEVRGTLSIISVSLSTTFMNLKDTVVSIDSKFEDPGKPCRFSGDHNHSYNQIGSVLDHNPDV
ncbi:Hypothetical predicted protein [Octopus vulgaris]|uniref:Uncharacterized protein n=1 Tax=Octopus vulgaris TaxID=6645 RepID=A0AA36B306_OCTVU|nr:Hypothetical predicted protein [Octopus vulgaris]